MTEQDAAGPTNWESSTQSEISGSARDVVQARDVSGGVHYHYGQETGAMPVPRQLPALVRDFAGRSDDLQVLDALLPNDDAGPDSEDIGSRQPGAVVISAINGTAGVGKTTLAVYWAYRVRRYFPDGALYANLRGYGPGEPAMPSEVLDEFLRALGTPPARIPSAVDGQAALYRTLLDGRRTLVLLDNARDADQVRPLLPPTGTCLTLITSRSHMAGLAVSHGAAQITLGLLSADEAITLLRKIIGEARADAEPAALAEMAYACAYLPLALRIAGQRAAFRPYLSLEEIVAELRDQRSKLDVLSSTGDPTTAVRSVFTWSYRALLGDQARLFRLLGLHPAVEISAQTATALGDTSPEHAHRILEALSGVHLVESAGQSRYRTHDLLHVYARELAEQTDSAGDRAAAVERLCNFYLYTADNADRAMMMRRRITLDACARPRYPINFASNQAASAWFDAEHTSLAAVSGLAAEAGMHAAAWRIPATMNGWYEVAGPRKEWLMAMRNGVTAARLADDRWGEIYHLQNLSDALMELHQTDEAAEYALRAIDIARQQADREAEACSMQYVALAYAKAEQFGMAADWWQQAIVISMEDGDERAAALGKAGLGEAYRGLGRFEEAADCLRQASQYFRETRARDREALALRKLGDVYREVSRIDSALDCYRQASNIAGEIGSRALEVSALDGIGIALLSNGDMEGAQEHWRQALALCEQINDPQAKDIRRRLAGLC